DACPAEGIVQLIFYYVGFMALGDVADYLIGLVVERVWPQASLLTFLALYFVSLWIAWLLAVKMTEPKASKQAARCYSFSSLPKTRAVLLRCTPSARSTASPNEFDRSMGASARPLLCKAGMNIPPRWKRRRTCVRFGLLG